MSILIGDCSRPASADSVIRNVEVSEPPGVGKVEVLGFGETPAIDDCNMRMSRSSKNNTASDGGNTAVNKRKEKHQEDFYMLGNELMSSATLEIMAKKYRDFRLAFQRLTRSKLSRAAYERALTFLGNVRIGKKARLVELLADDILTRLNDVEEANDEYAALLQTDDTLGELEKKLFDSGRKMCTTNDFEAFLELRSIFVTLSETMIQYLEGHPKARNTIRRFVVRCQLVAQVQHARFLVEKLYSLQQGGDN